MLFLIPSSTFRSLKSLRYNPIACVISHFKCSWRSAPASCGTHRGREMAARDVPGGVRLHLLTTPHVCKSSTVRGRNCARVPGAHWLRRSHHCKTLQCEPVEFTQSHRLLRGVDWSLKRRLNVPPPPFSTKIKTQTLLRRSMSADHGKVRHEASTEPAWALAPTKLRTHTAFQNITPVKSPHTRQKPLPVSPQQLGPHPGAEPAPGFTGINLYHRSNLSFSLCQSKHGATPLYTSLGPESLFNLPLSHPILSSWTALGHVTV